MDLSLMSIDSFDDEDFIGQALNDSIEAIGGGNDSTESASGAIDISGLISGKVTTITSNGGQKRGLDFDNLDTPKNCAAVRERKRKNNARRCLSTDLIGDRSPGMSFQEFRYSSIKMTTAKTETISSVFKSPNYIPRKSPKMTPKEKENPDMILDLTPEFNFHGKKPGAIKSKEDGDTEPRIPLKNSGNKRANGSAGFGLQKCFSENHATIMRAVQISASDPTLIGDFTKTYLLPLMQNSKHRDLKSISCHVLAELLRERRYVDQIESCVIIDCRYPYEYEGGHIKSAVNLYTQEQILERFIKGKPHEAAGTKTQTMTTTTTKDGGVKRKILIFHCEFSSERGPSLCRFLRNKDRVKNSSVYPNLHYPEIYLLEGGYKEFYSYYADLCEPRAYRPMHHKDHEDDLRHFRSICKSFESKCGGGTSVHPKRNWRI